MRNTSLGCSLLLALFLILTPPSSAIADEKIDTVVEKLGSSSVNERVHALRDLSRMNVPSEKARPILTSMMEDPVGTVRAETVWAIQALLKEDGADLLEKLYFDPERRVRDSVIRVACSMFDKPRMRDLCRLAADDQDHSARVDVIVVLKEKHPRSKEAAEIFRRGLEDPSELVQRAAVFGVQSARDTKAVDQLARIAMTSSNHVAIPAADEALATIATPAAVDHLIKMLPKPKGAPGKPARPTDEVRAAAARALARIKDTRALPELRKLLTDSYVPVRIGAMEALLQMKDVASAPAIAKQLSFEEERVRRFALRALRVIGDPGVAKAVEKTLREDKEPIVRATAVSTLADLVGEAAIPVLAKQAGDLDASVRLEIAGALSGLGKEAAPALAKLVGDEDYGVRAVAIEGLGQIGGVDEVPMLIEAAKDTSKRNRTVRGSVCEALGRIGGAEAVAGLTALAGDPDPSVRQRVARALARIGDEKGLKVLDKLARDSVARVRITARRELEKLGRSPAAATSKEK